MLTRSVSNVCFIFCQTPYVEKRYQKWVSAHFAGQFMWKSPKIGWKTGISPGIFGQKQSTVPAKVCKNGAFCPGHARGLPMRFTVFFVCSLGFKGLSWAFFRPDSWGSGAMSGVDFLASKSTVTPTILRPSLYSS